MYINQPAYFDILQELKVTNATLVAVSKTKPVEAILELYEAGQRDFGENYVQELAEKQAALPGDIRWHFIGHLQTNKVKLIVPFVHLIHGVDSYKLLIEINKQAKKLGRTIDVLLQVHIAKEETKFGFDEEELHQLFHDQQADLKQLQNINIAGFMGMASFTDDKEIVRQEFKKLKYLFDGYARYELFNGKLQVLSMGMSGDYRIALQEGSTMVRIGSLLFGARK